VTVELRQPPLPERKPSLESLKLKRERVQVRLRRTRNGA
jgi:hypothetical protein